MPAAKFEIVRKCKVCGELFKAKTIESWYCSPRCSKIAWKRNKDEELRMQKLDEVVKKIPKSKDYITVPEAYALFGISKETLYRLIRKGVISSVNVGERQTRAQQRRTAETLSSAEESSRQNQSPLPNCIAWNRRTVIPSAKYPRNSIWTTARSISISANTLSLPGR